MYRSRYGTRPVPRFESQISYRFFVVKSTWQNFIENKFYYHHNEKMNNSTVRPSVRSCISSFYIGLISRRFQKIRNSMRFCINSSDTGNSLEFSRKSAENRFPGKFWKKIFLQLKHFYVCFQGNKGPWFKNFRFQVLLEWPYGRN